MSNVHKLTAAPLPGECNEELISALRDLVDRAEKGEIQAAAWAGYTNSHNDTIFTGWDGAGKTMFQLCAAVSMLDSRYREFLMSEPE